MYLILAVCCFIDGEIVNTRVFFFNMPFIVTYDCIHEEWALDPGKFFLLLLKSHF